ncbi:MAG: hypothetical protein Q9160_001112 [Pyrenula sp. 1 TL-2023]
MSKIDLDALKARALGSGSEDAVTVNTRVLIDKVLARYPGEWTVLRELLQNAADASATQVVIRFETLPSTTVPAPQSADPTASIKHVLSHHTLKRLIVSNNGSPFNSNDWSRLKRIAEGNPDETKIGAFGVGFYSVFSDCEEPFVSSGDQAMAFYWKGNSLFTRRLSLDKGDSSPDTTFLLNYRSITSPVPNLLPLCQFLSTSLTFVGLEKIDLWLDEWNVLSLSRKAAPAMEMSIPRDIEPKTSGGLMKIVNLERGVAQIDGKWLDAVAWRPPKASGRHDTSRSGETAPSLRSFFSRLAGGHSSFETEDTSRNNRMTPTEPLHDLCKPQTTTVFLHIYTAKIQTSTTRNFNQELERATKKPPPKTTKIAVLTSSFDGSSVSSDQKPFADVFATVLPTKSGRIFIGFPTHQTTGLGAHISAPSLIPTVERESVDLNARWVKDWNLELLRAAGIVCRVAWTAQIALMEESVSRDVKSAGRSKIREDDVAKYIPGFVSAAQNFTFRDSTPLANVGNVVEDFFWTCSKNASINVLSTCGVLPTYEVRITPKDLSFMSDIPVLPEKATQDAKNFVAKLVDFGLVTEVTVSDIKAALERTPLTSTQLGEFLSWIGRKAVQGEISEDTVRNLMTVAVASIDSDGGASQLILLAGIKNYLNANRIPSHMPLPPFVMSFSFTKQIGDKELKALGWQELQIVPWLRWLTDESSNRASLSAEQDITTSPSFARSVLPIVSRSWEGLGTSSKDSVLSALSSRTIIPTTQGMKKPSEAYFANVKIFEDLPLVSGLNGVKDKLLVALGVRKTIELGLVFDRLLAKPNKSEGEPEWSHVDLIKYLASVRNDIPSDDTERLKSARICPKEAEKGLEGSSRQYRFEDLYEPKPALRDLGLPVLQWPPNYRSISAEGRFMTSLGLKSHPTVPQLIEIIAKASEVKNYQARDKAMGYFLSNHRVNGYHSFDYSKISTPFLPLQNSDALANPSNCFTNESAALLGFNVLQTSLHSHSSDFGVQKNPPIQACLETFLQRLPTSRKEARAIFSYFSDRLAEINPAQYQRLSQEKFIPIFEASHKAEGKGRTRYVSPTECYLGDSDNAYNGIFDFCDFGQDANAFLLKCGSKHEPTKVEIARMLVKEPAHILSKLGDHEKYLNLLRSLGDSIGTLRKDKILFRDMGKAPFLLASRFVPTAKKPTSARQQGISDEFEDADEEDFQGITEWVLTSAQSSIVIDDYTSYSLFKNSILAVPQEEGLEDLYNRLGCPRLSELVEESAKHGPLLKDQGSAEKLQKQIFERSRLFLYDQPPDTVKHDTRWLEKNLVVQAVSSVSLKRSLRNLDITHVEKRKAVVTHSRPHYTLWMTSGSIDFYQVSQALVNLLLSRPKVHSAIALETILRTDLRELGLRGYNVGRILRQKATEARLAETRRQQQLEEERKQIEADEASWKALQASTTGADADRSNVPPGGFPDSPDRISDSKGSSAVQGNEENAARSTRGFMSNLTRRLGLDEGGRNSRQLQSLLGNTPSEQPTPAPQIEQAPPPPYSAQDPDKPKGPSATTATPPHQIQQNLLSAIKKSRPYNSSDLYSRGETNTVFEASSYCDEKPAQDLTYAAEGAHGIRIFVPKNFANATAFLSSNSQGLSLFTSILKDITSIFAMRLDSMNVFFAPSSQSIAFNSKGTVFCNYHFFQQWHLPKLLQARDSNAAKRDAMTFWWVTLCHELAHNLVEDHSANHSYYIESFVAGYFEKAAKVFGVALNESSQPARTTEMQPTTLMD